MKKIFLLLVFAIFAVLVQAQDVKQKERKKIKDLFLSSISKSNFKDTNMVYMFAVKVKVSVNKTVNIKSITVSDSSAYLIYKNFDFLSKIDYKLLMGNQTESTFVFPVCIFLEYPGKEFTGYLNMQDLQKKLNNYWFIRNEYEKVPTEEYIYFPALNLRTSTIVSY